MCDLLLEDAAILRFGAQTERRAGGGLFGPPAALRCAMSLLKGTASLLASPEHRISGRMVSVIS
jgi:hypothetical protein